MNINRNNSYISDKWQFKPFQVSQTGEPLKALNLPNDYELLVAERNGEHRAFSVREMAYHHIAQGTLGGEPFMVVF